MDTKDEFVVRVKNISVNRSGRLILDEISFILHIGEHLAITGVSGSGKSTLGLVLAGKIFHKGEIEYTPSVSNSIVWTEQQHHFKNRYNISDLYYQQRFNSYDSEETQTVIGSLVASDGETGKVLQMLGIEYLRDKPLIQLSNGENKKLQVAQALLLQPSVLIMDQPFIGLDAVTRSYMHDLINALANQGILIILITSVDEMPDCISKVITLDKGNIKSIESRKDFLENHPKQDRYVINTVMADKAKLEKHSSAQDENFEYAIRMKNVNVQYGEKRILQDINWEVKKGERWLLSGPNGAGKSTLLSLVTADNPQAYANEVYLFDKKRGSGESIWDIKKKIGYLSPELHLFFDQGCTCFEAIASGLFDTIGLFRQLSEADAQTIVDWAEMTGIKDLLQKRLFELSAGEQRMVLLTRALVKNPPLLILDEPCQGMDDEKQSQLLELINSVCLYGNKTMVFVTHYADEKPACIDRFINLEEGKITGAGIF
jgi:molybdate transport system ATP-binding protein